MQEMGRIVWSDLTVPNADEVSKFYQEVVGWVAEPLDMGGYNDYTMSTPGPEGDVVSGVCHAKGENADIPAQWLLYVKVPNIEAALEKVNAFGGEVLGGIRSLGSFGRICIIKDPAGAVMALSDGGDE